MDLGLNGRTALVLGSTSGLGYAIAGVLVGEGAKVVISGRGADSTRRAADSLETVGVAADLTRQDEVEGLIDRAESELGHLDILVLNSGGPAPGTAEDLSDEIIRAGIDLLLAPHVRITHRVLATMKERGWGRIVAIGSTGVMTPNPNMAMSSVGRSALVAFLKTLAAEVAASGVTVNVVHPGRIDTRRVEELDAARARRENSTPEQIRAQSEASIPVGRYGRPEEFAAAVAFLCSDPASYITGVQLRVDGGLIRAY